MNGCHRIDKSVGRVTLCGEEKNKSIDYTSNDSTRLQRCACPLGCPLSVRGVASALVCSGQKYRITGHERSTQCLRARAQTNHVIIRQSGAKRGREDEEKFILVIENAKWHLRQVALAGLKGLLLGISFVSLCPTLGRCPFAHENSVSISPL